MITKVRIQGYRIYTDTIINFNTSLNIVVGGNESGKSTLIEAITLALTGRVNGKAAEDELSPFWFNQPLVEDYFESVRAGSSRRAPEICIEVFLENSDDLQRLRGANNSLREECPGVSLAIRPNAQYAEEFREYVKKKVSVLPVEYYEVDWRDFGDRVLTRRPKEVLVAAIDSRTVRSTSHVDYYTREVLSSQLSPQERAEVSIAYRTLKERLSKDALAGVNAKIGSESAALQGKQVGLSMDHSSRSSWESAVVPHVQEIPFSMAGQGQQASIKIVLAMSRMENMVDIVMIEEPENHLSHTSLNVLMDRIQGLATPDQQLVIATHSSFVLNRLGLDSLILLNSGRAAQFANLSPDTVRYFQKLPGYDTLRLVLADRVALVEGPSDEIIFEALFLREFGHRPIDEGVDVVSMRGLSLARGLEVCRGLDKKTAAIRDIDKCTEAELREGLGGLLADGRRELFAGQPDRGVTLEPQVIWANDDRTLHGVLGLTPRADLESWMTRNKTEAALRIAESTAKIEYPDYLVKAAKFIHE